MNEMTEAAVGPKRVLVADDHTMVGEAVANLLESEGRYVARTVASFDGVIQALAEGPAFDLILLDIKMPGMQGLISLDEILKRTSGRIVIFSGYAEARFVRDALNRGAAGFIPKTMPVHALKSAIDLIMSGQVFAPVNYFEQDTTAALDLNEVERMVLRRLAEGVVNKIIAAELNLTEVRVKMHVRRICQKLNVANRTQAAITARELDLI